MEGDVSNIELLMGPTRSRILHELAYSDKNLDSIAGLLKIGKNAVKEHTDLLEKKGYIQSYFKNEGVGRPKKYFRLTEKGISLFPKQYSLLAKLLIEEIEEDLGQGYLNELLGRVARRMLSSEDVKDHDHSNASREDKIKRLKEFVLSLNRLGYFAKIEIDADRVRIIRHNCIFYELAKTNEQIICGELGKNIVKDGVGTSFTINETISGEKRTCVVEVRIPEEA